jgi:hypothetical protein
MILAFVGSLTLPILKTIIPIRQFLIIFQYLFVLFGLSIGSFGLFGREIMNRRFGQASLLAYSSRTLPVSERKIFFNFVVKDIIYYFILWILPFALGFALASPFISISFVYSLSLLLILTLSFLIGLSVVFFLSTIYAHSIKLLIVILALIATFSLFSFYYSDINLSFLFSSLSFSYLPSFNQIAFSLFVIIIPTAFSLTFLKVDYPQKKRLFKNSLDKISNWFKFSKHSIFMSKDFLDFNRSEGGLGKIIFSFLLPLVLVWFLIFVFLRFIPILNLFVIFSIFLGIMSSSFYNWFTEFDAFTSYAFLPVNVSTLIKSKVNSYILINLVSLAVLILVALWTNQMVYFLPALFSFLAVSSYTLSITVYLAGLGPNILLYNAKIFAEYLLLISPLLLALIFSSAVNPFYLIFSLFLIPISCGIVKKSYSKWDKTEQPHF